MGFLLVKAMNLQSFETLENNNLVKYNVHQGENIGITSLTCDVKDSTMSNSQCVMPSISFLLSFYTIPIFLIL